MFHIEVHWKESFQSNTELGFIQQSLSDMENSQLWNPGTKGVQREVNKKTEEILTDEWIKEASEVS